MPYAGPYLGGVTGARAPTILYPRRWGHRGPHFLRQNEKTKRRKRKMEEGKKRVNWLKI